MPDQFSIDRAIGRGACGIPNAWTARKISGGMAREPEMLDHNSIAGLFMGKIQREVDVCAKCHQTIGDGEMETEHVGNEIIVRHKQCPPQAAGEAQTEKETNDSRHNGATEESSPSI
jgi:hypothetical protein